MENSSPAWLNRKEYPFESRFLSITGKRMHYIDTGKGKETILFVHGTPSWSFDFRIIIKRLSAKFRCVAIDHIGFGLSEKPEQYDYSTQHHSATLEKFIEALALENITLVVHDFGGPIGLNYAIRHPDNISKMVILNSWMWSSEEDPEFKKFRKILKSPLLPFLYKRLNFSPRFLLPGSLYKKKLTGEIHRHYLKPFPEAAQRNGPLAFAKSLLNDQEWFESLWQKKNSISDKPVFFIWGLKDKFIRPLYLKKFQQGFPNYKTLELECGHFPQEEEGEKVAQAMEEWLIK